MVHALTDRRSTVIADDGTALAVTEVGSAASPLTVVFVHGFCLHSGAWIRQRQTLARQWRGRARLVFYDHRGHGRSGGGSAESYTIEQLAQDLDAVLRAVVPTGPIVLVGHSMGGMTVLSHLTHPRATTSRVRGVALISTAADQLTTSGVCRLINTPLTAFLRSAATIAPAFVQRAWTLSRRLLTPAIGATFPRVPTAVARATTTSCHMIHATPITTITRFLDSFGLYDASHAFPALRAVPHVALVGGTRDLVTPIGHTHRLAEAVPNAEALIVEGGRHMLILEQPEVVNACLHRLLTQIHRVHTFPREVLPAAQ